MIRWLHISDLHLGSEGAVTAMLRDELPIFLKEKGLVCDYVFCTGDIRTANVEHNEFTDEMAEYIKQVCESVGVSEGSLFIVPGNHDINRDAPGRAEAINNAFYGNESYYEPENGTIKTEDMSRIMSGETEFKEFLRKIYSPERIDLYGNPAAPHFNVETDDFNILHLDTTIAYTEGHEKFDFVLGTNALYKVIKGLNKEKPTILLTHFPFGCLKQSEKKTLSVMLQHNTVHLWLAGHEHEQIIGNPQYLTVLQSGELRIENASTPSFLIGEYEPESFKCKITAYYWMKEGWYKYPYVNLDNTPEDVYEFDLYSAEQKKNVKSQALEDMSIPIAGKIGNMVNNPAIQNVNIVLSASDGRSHRTINEHVVERSSLLERCVSELSAGKLLVLYGTLKIGKTMLSHQIWKAMPDIAVYDNIHYEQLETTVDILLQNNRNGKAVIVTTAALNLNCSGFDYSKVCQIEVPLMTLGETKLLVSTYSPSKDFSMFIWSQSCGHPVLIKTLCDYLSSCDWSVDESNFSDVLNFSFDYSLSRSIASLMKKIIPDKQDRDFLNRLLLVKGMFSQRDAIELAGIEPQIDEPLMRLTGLIPNWVMPVENLLKINPLFDKIWKPEIHPIQSVACHRLLASNILKNRKILNEHDVLNYIFHSIQARDYDNAGDMYITVMLKIQEGGNLPERSILRSIWIDVPTPEGMSLHTRIGIRVIQLISFRNIKKLQRRYILNDLVSLVHRCEDKDFLPFYYSVITMFSFLDGDISLGLENYGRYLENKDNGKALLENADESISVFDTNIWFFLLLAEKEEDYIKWLNSFDAETIEYKHDDIQVCESCYISINRFIDFYLKEETIDARLLILNRIQKLAKKRQCPELAIVSIFKQMELLVRNQNYSEARDHYNSSYHLYEAFPLAQILLNGSMGNTYYRDKNVANEQAIPYFEQVLSVKQNDLIPDIRSHMQQLYAYVISDKDESKCVAILEEVLKFVDNEKHRVDIYEYYQCAGELSFACWCVGNRRKAVELLSSCVSFVLSDVKNGTSIFAKGFLCLCDCLVFKYLFDIDNKPIPEEQASPFHGMFSESGLTDLNDLYSEERIYTTSYQMCEVCRKLDLYELATEWAYKTVEACRDRNAVREYHYLVFLLLPLFVAKNDLDTIKYVIEHSCKARMLSYQNNLELKRDTADAEFIEYQIIPILMAALSMKLRDDNAGIELIKQVLEEYNPVKDADLLDKVKDVFTKTTYDRSFIAEINSLDVNQYYVVYVCAYLMTALYTDSYYAFTLLIAVLPSLDKHFSQVLGKGAKAIMNRFVADFWKARILQSPDEFIDFKFLREKGLPMIYQYEGKANQANHTMYIVQYHLKGRLTLKSEQETWLEI